ncbi:MAG TPA: VOC family protein [Tahibacter sp.]|nr:VOC family protein [Tahibacter sp.]
MQFPPACPEIPVTDLAASLAYYRDRLGFTVDWSDADLGLAGLSRGDARVFMSNAAFRAHLRTAAGPVVLWFNPASRAEVDAVHAQWAAAGAAIDAPPSDKPYKLYEFLANDPDGNWLRVFYDFGGEETCAPA